MRLKPGKYIYGALLIVFFVVLSACQTREVVKPTEETTVIMVRHAERTIIGAVLTERGHKNARALVDVLGDMKINAIYSPDLERNLDTVRPLAKHLGIEINKMTGEWYPDEVVDIITKKHAGQTVLWVGNTDNLPDIYEFLGGEGAPPVKYGDLYILTLSKNGKTSVVKKSWGDNK
ncbi:histidine phosphatase family protein [Kaarinaea lacus]